MLTIKIYRNQDIDTKSGDTLTAYQLRERPFFKPLFSKVTQVIYLDEDGLLNSFGSLGDCARNLGVEITDGETDEEIEQKLNDAQKAHAEQDAQEQIRQATLDERIEANAAAIEELAAALFAEE